MTHVTHGELPLRLGLVGCGAIADAHLEAGLDVDTVSWTQVVDLRPQAARRAAESAGCGWSCEYHREEMTSLDAVVVCTPPNTHLEIARFFLEHQVPVLVEKPLVLESLHARELTRLAGANGVLLMMASKFRFVADVVEARRRIAAGELGEPVLYQNTFTGRVSMAERWNSKPEISGGGVLMDNGPHAVDLARYLLGPLRSIQAQLGSDGSGVEHSARAQLGTDGAVLAAFDLSWVTHVSDGSFIRVCGREGELRLGWGASCVRRSGDWETFGSGYDKRAAFRAQLENFAAAVRGREAARVSTAAAVAAVEAVEAGYASARLGRRIPLGTLSSEVVTA